MPKKRGICSIEDCGRPHSGLGLCYMHWKRQHRNGTTERLIEEHGMTHSPEYKSWNRMRRRCLDPNEKAFPDYGGRGIVVDPRWINSFVTFYADMGPKPSSQHSIDRINNDGPYSPENCRWATRAEQSRNKRTNTFLTYKGRTQCMSDWATEYGIALTTLYYRLQRGLSMHAALTTPVGRWAARR